MSGNFQKQFKDGLDLFLCEPKNKNKNQDRLDAGSSNTVPALLSVKP
jgi:hypothetical protein